MELRVSRYLLAVAKEETISGAAESLNVTQPILSKQLIDLEEELGEKLFIRGNRKVTLTAEGLFLMKLAQEIVELVEKTEPELNRPDEAVSGDIYIDGGETDAMRLIGRWWFIPHPLGWFFIFCGINFNLLVTLGMTTASIINFLSIEEPQGKPCGSSLRKQLKN